MATTRAATRPSGVRIWLMAARVRTLPAAVAPVLVGTALAGYLHVFHPLRFVAALLGAMFIQVGTNLSNDYSDARRGADTEDRLGPVRVTAGGLVPPAPGADRDLRDLRPGGARRRLPDRGRRLAAAARRGRLDPRRRALHRRPAAVRLRGARRAVRVPVLRHRRGRGSYFVQVKHLDWEAFALAVPVGLLAAGDPGRQQRARHRHRPPRRQAHAGGAARARAHPRAVRGDRLPGLSARARDVDVRPAEAVAAAALADAAARRPGRAGGAQPRRRRRR